MNDTNFELDLMSDVRIGYAVRENGSFRAVSTEMTLDDGEVFYDELPQWVIDLLSNQAELNRLSGIENEWRNSEINVIANQLMAIEEADAAIEEGLEPPSDLLFGTRNQWLSYRTKVRAWKEGNVDFPDKSKRPTRPK